MNKRKSISLLLLVPLVGASLLVFCPMNFSIGDTKIEKSLGRVGTNPAGFASGVAHVSWVSSLGTMSRGDIYTVNVGGWMWKFDIYKPGTGE